ncbi:MAG: NAD(P)/FAD-dependent oxidoreductase [Desulfobacterales bacterium]
MNKNVAIIGGSAAGLLTAKMLAEQGLNVKVFEAAETIDPAPRTLIVTGQLPKFTGPLYKSALINKIHRFELFTDGRVAEISLRQPDLVIERSKLLDDLATQAKESGARIFTGHRFLNLKPNGKNIAFNITNNGNGKPIEETTDILIGADGAFSRVAKSGGWPEQATVPLIQSVVKLPEEMPSDTTRVWFLPEDTPYFYWLIPHSPTHGVLGLIAEENNQGRMQLEQFIEKKGLEPIEHQSARIPIYRRWIPIHRKIGEGDVYLVGDAAGHVKATTVGGVVTGFRGALTVVDDILNKKSSNLKVLRRELDLHALVRKTLQGFTQADYIKLLDILNPSTMRTLSSFNRDETVKLLFHLFIGQPRLLLLGLRTILLDKLPLLKSTK